MSHLVSIAAKPADCPRCRKPVLAAVDEGIPARVDITPLPDRAAEIAALLQGRWTYVLTANNELIYRDAARIASGRLRGTIHADHKCGGPVQLTIDEMMGAQ